MKFYITVTDCLKRDRRGDDRFPRTRRWFAGLDRDRSAHPSVVLAMDGIGALHPLHASLYACGRGRNPRLASGRPVRGKATIIGERVLDFRAIGKSFGARRGEEGQ